MQYVRKGFLREDPTLVCAAEEQSDDEKKDDNTDVLFVDKGSRLTRFRMSPCSCRYALA